jgi:hypothetical protein
MGLMRMSEREYWAEVAKRPAMFLGRTTLTGLEAYLRGYDDHSRRHGGPGLDGWNDWLVTRLGATAITGGTGRSAILHLATSGSSGTSLQSKSSRLSRCTWNSSTSSSQNVEQSRHGLTAQEWCSTG